MRDKCKNAGVEISSEMMGDGDDEVVNKQHNAGQNTTALTTLIPDSHRNTAKNDQLIADLQAKLASIADEKSSLVAHLNKKNEEWNDGQLELKECHSHIDELRNSNTLIQKRYEELHSAKAHLDKLFQSLNTGTDANASRFNTEKLQWNEDKMQFMEEIRIKDNKINELQIKNVSNNKLIKELQLAKND